MKYSILIILLCVLQNCSKDVSTDQVLKNLQLSTHEVAADGQSTVSARVELPDKTSSDRRTVIFSTSSGVFTSSGTNKLTARADFTDGVLKASATLIAPTQPGTIVISVKPEFDSQQSEFMLSDSVIASSSVPVSLDLEPSAFGIAANHLNEVFITGKLKNASGKFVSNGYRVLFEDLIAFTPANGQFRNLQAITADSSMVSTYYSAFAHPIGTQIKIRGTLLHPNGQKTLADSIFLTINQ